MAASRRSAWAATSSPAPDSPDTRTTTDSPVTAGASRSDSSISPSTRPRSQRASGRLLPVARSRSSAIRARPSAQRVSPGPAGSAGASPARSACSDSALTASTSRRDACSAPAAPLSAAASSACAASINFSGERSRRARSVIARSGSSATAGGVAGTSTRGTRARQRTKISASVRMMSSCRRSRGSVSCSMRAATCSLESPLRSRWQSSPRRSSNTACSVRCGWPMILS